VTAFVNTMLAPLATLAIWMALDRRRSGHVTAVGVATAVVVGLVAITPAAGFVSPAGALAIGAIAALPSYFGLVYRSRTRLDDSLDVVAAHGLGGLTGALLTGVFASAEWGGTAGLLEGNGALVGRQALAVAATLVFSGVMTFVVLKLVGLFIPLRAAARVEGRGLDVALHGEEAYGSGEGAILVLPLKPAPGAPVPAISTSPAPVGAAGA
jgi:Amt family ammonium transporter